MPDGLKNDENNESGINPAASDYQQNDIYFSDRDYSKAVKRENGKTAGRIKKLKGKNGTVTSTYLFFIIVIAVSMIISIYAVFCLNDIFGITKSQSSVTVNYTEQIDNTSDAIDVLADYGLIRCKNFCKLYVKLARAVVGDYDVSPPFEAGVYYLNGKMGLEGMLINMMGNPETSETVKITFLEGYTTADIINKLVENEVCDKAALLSVIESTDFSYSLVSGLTSKETVPYRLEGYLFPNTYNFYVGQSASSVIETFLQETEKEITQEDRNRAKELGYSMQEIITIASIVQAEAGSDEQMPTIAAVIENRLKDTTNYPSLGCQSTSDYITKKIASSLSSTSAHTADYYLQYYNTNSTSNVVGLPEGPICNPGKAAIQAALYPADINDYFFFHDSNGNLYTAKNNSEFKSKVQKYAPYLSY
ncbi:MAG: endolytic transglycosylase MltG [Clostridiales bacterium]|nr:endolytic transglycosylase MltG [Clostridiales bacterium]